MDRYCKSNIEMEDSGDEAFKNFIVVCESNGSDKENVPRVSEPADSDEMTDTVKRQKTNKEQFDKIIEFTKVYNRDSTGKSMLDELWEKLTLELNVIGPPTRTALQWRRVWSIYKYNIKRAESKPSTASRGSSSKRTKGRQNRGASTSKTDRPLSERHRTSGSDQLLERPQTLQADERVLTLLSQIVQQQSTIIQNQEITNDKIQTSNELLAKMAEKSDQ